MGGLVLAVAGGSATTDSGAPSTGSSWLKIDPRPGAAAAWPPGSGGAGRRAMPSRRCQSGCRRWIRSRRPGRSGLGALLSGVNPKNLILTVGATAAIAQTNASNGSQVAALIVFIVIGSLGVGAPVAIYFGMGERSAGILANLRGWMTHNNAAIMVVLCLIIGAKLIGDGITGLSA